jgi:hypothetical protein
VTCQHSAHYITTERSKGAGHILLMRLLPELLLLLCLLLLLQQQQLHSQAPRRLLQLLCLLKAAHQLLRGVLQLAAHTCWSDLTYTQL